MKNIALGRLPAWRGVKAHLRSLRRIALKDLRQIILKATRTPPGAQLEDAFGDSKSKDSISDCLAEAKAQSLCEGVQYHLRWPKDKT